MCIEFKGRRGMSILANRMLYSKCCIAAALHDYKCVCASVTKHNQSELHVIHN